MSNQMCTKMVYDCAFVLPEADNNSLIRGATIRNKRQFVIGDIS